MTATPEEKLCVSRFLLQEVIDEHAPQFKEVMSCYLNRLKPSRIVPVDPGLPAASRSNGAASK